MKNSEVSEKVMIILLIVAIFLSLFSIVLTFTFDGSHSFNSKYFSNEEERSSANVELIIGQTEANSNA
jgi:flagellar basal body-associated protein FliL